MKAYKSEFINRISERGLLNQCTDLMSLDKLATKPGEIIAYIGFDCTAKSLHVGSLLSIMLLRHLQQSGHKPIILLGNGTSKIGDPSGKDESRQLLSESDINENMNSIKNIFKNYLQFGTGPTDASIVTNADWLNNLNYIKFLRDFGTCFTINRMLTFDSVKSRLDREQPLSFLEFNYMVLQAYDFYRLYKDEGCVLQMGGSDQWGNIINGVELIRRTQYSLSGKKANAWGLTTPLLTSSSGRKMGKTVKGAIWLNRNMLSAYDYWQFWRNTADSDLSKYLKLFTELPLDEISRLEKLSGAEMNDAKKILADETTKLCHGEKTALDARHTSEQTFEQKLVGDQLRVFNVPRSELETGILVFQLFHSSGLVESNSEARRLIKGGGGRINDDPVSNETSKVSITDLNANGTIKLSAGKKRHVLIRAV